MKIDIKGRIKQVADRSGADVRYSLDSSRIKRLGWKPKITFDEGIREVIESYQRRNSNSKIK